MLICLPASFGKENPHCSQSTWVLLRRAGGQKLHLTQQQHLTPLAL